MFPRMYRVTIKDLYAGPYTSMLAPVVARSYLNDIQAYNTSHADKHAARA
jgi:hypothetical protein